MTNLQIETLEQLEAEREQLSEKFKTEEVKTPQTLEALQKVEAKIKAKKEHVRREEKLKESYRESYEQRFGTNDGFDQLWTEKLRSEAIMNELREHGESIRRAMRHEIYQKW